MSDYYVLVVNNDIVVDVRIKGIPYDHIYEIDSEHNVVEKVTQVPWESDGNAVVISVEMR